MTREEELRLIDEAVAAGKCKLYPPGASSDAQETLTRVYGHMIPGALKRAVDAVVRKA